MSGPMGMPIIALPTATPNRNVASRLPAKKPTSQTRRHAGESVLLRNSSDTARKIRANSRAMNAR